MERYTGNDIVNIGSGQEVTIRDLATAVKNAVGYQGAVEFDPAKPDGTPRKLLDCSKLHNMGWHHSIELGDGIKRAYEDFKKMLVDKSFSNRM